MRRRRPLVLALPLLAALAGAPALMAVQPAAPAAFSDSLVPVDVQVLGRDGKPVTGLTRADFTVLEDGVPQQVREALPVALAPGTAAPDARLAPRTGLGFAPPDRRIFVFVLGLGRLEDRSGMISGLTRFVRTQLLPQDEVAIFAYDRALDFTADHQQVAAALERFKKGHSGVDFDLSAELGPTKMGPLYGARVLPKKLQARIDQLVLGPNPPAPATVASEEIQGPDLVRMPLDAFMASCATTLRDQNNLASLMEYLRRFEGRKHVVFVTEQGLPWPSDDNDRALAALANDGRVSIHAVQAGGLLDPEAAKEMEATYQQAQSFRSLRALSELTGGVASITEQGPGVFDRIDQATRSGYLLGYQSSNASWSGGYRAIVVRVNRPDVTVLYRHGYYREAGATGFNRRGFIANDRLSAGGIFRREVGDIKVKAAVSSRDGNLVAEGKIDLKNVKVESAGGFRVGLLNVAVYCLDNGSNTVGTHADALPLKLSEADYAKYLESGYPYTIQFPAIRGTQNVRLVVYDFGSDLVGRADTRVF